MAAPALWQPQEQGLREICTLLEAHISPNSDQARIWQQLQHYSQFPDFNNYLVFLLARGEALHKCLDSNDLDHMEGAMDAIYKICEDVPEELDVDVPGLSERPINVFMPRILQFFQSPHATLRKLALGCINQYIVVMPSIDPTAAGALYDREFIVCSLDLLSGLAEGLGAGIESLVAQSNLRDLLLQCCMDEAADVRQSALALLGDLSRVCPIHLHPRLQEFLTVAAKQLSPQSVKDAVSVANNACWAIGELAIKIGKEIEPVVISVVSCLVPILKSPEGLNKSLIENSAITLGRLSWVCPDIMAPHMDHFMQAWIRDDFEKEDAFHGLCAMVAANPSGAVGSLAYICQACASWTDIKSEGLHNEVCQILNGYKQVKVACF
nr:unnamed protein product [Digitaria exilis]